MITVKQSGSFKNIEKFLKAMLKRDIYKALDYYGRTGVDALASATAIDSGISADSWYYEVEETRSTYSISWFNSNTVDGVPIVILLQYGHGTGTGGYVEGEDFINPAIKPVFDKIADSVWKAVTSA